MELNDYRARLILDIAHAAWSRGDIEGVLASYVDDVFYSANTYGPDGAPLIVAGRENMRSLLEPIALAAECISVPEYFRFADGVGRARIQYYLRDRATGHVMVGSFRQVVKFRNNKISHLEEYHDAARMSTFWSMISRDAEIDKVLRGVEPSCSQAEFAKTS